ncbi:hypothetical protein EV189_2101 [Motilibacter rhizosphaerae]|uniref:Uncharacterized protein n=1 Tax=Motilibacter rhizosphaerae TaxID=598652 RepID=A0A4Q7NT28_9ACTN|nr:hypothetical protein [Motilibacter rhizosphaerae]RZS90316.1 hypothetical protein EV189_2101 [Motilibacter rhizosphaerae]
MSDSPTVDLDKEEPTPPLQPRSSQHRFDPLPLVLGAVLVALGVTYAGADARDQHVDAWVTTAVLVAGVALVAFAAAVRAVVRAARR